MSENASGFSAGDPDTAPTSTNDEPQDSPQIDDDAATKDNDTCRKRSQGKIMRGLLDEYFTLIRSTDGRMYGVPHADPGRAVQHEHQSSPLVRIVSRMFLDTEGRWPSTTAVSECSAYALAKFDDAPTQHVPLRCCWDRDLLAFYLDTCDEQGTVIRVDRNGVHEVEAPVPFRRATVPAPLPWPDIKGASAADLAPLWDLVPVAVDDRPLALALLLTAWMTETPQPIVTLTGPQDSGKTSTARYLLSLVDPLTVVRGRSLPRDEREWKAAVAQSRAVLVDNLSGLNAEASDLLCRVATGGEAASRELYTNDASHISNLYVPVWLTTIDPGALRGDLASRMVKLELAPLDESTRIAESELTARQEANRQPVTRGLLWLASQVMREWPTIDKSRLKYRMGDFAIAVRCIDKVLGTTGEKRLDADAQDLAADVVDASPLALAVVALFTPDPRTGKVRAPDAEVTAAELLALLEQVRNPDGWHARPDDRTWPRTPKILSAALTRIEPVLRQAHGIVIERGRTGKRRWLVLRRLDDTHGGAPAGTDEAF